MAKPTSQEDRLGTASPGFPAEAATPHSESEGWYLEAKIPGTPGVNRIQILKLPFRIGRGPCTDLNLASRSVSSNHAEIDRDESTGGLRLRDLRSTNGTFVNHQRIESALLAEGDIVHFAHDEFRVVHLASAPTPRGAEITRATMPLDSKHKLPHGFVPGALKILEFIKNQNFVPLFQPIVLLRDRSVVASEGLTRGQHPDLPEDPAELFRIASDLGLEAELSRAFRRRAIDVIAKQHRWPTLFLNTHPQESVADIIASAAEARQMAPHLDLVFEVHERTLVDVAAIRTLKTELARHRVGLAFDDFGTGQARLVELAEVPPDFLKFDINFIRNIDSAPESKRRVLLAIVGAASSLGVKTIAEGIETEAEAATCATLGFTHGQGFLFGRSQVCKPV